MTLKSEKKRTKEKEIGKIDRSIQGRNKEKERENKLESLIESIERHT